MFKNKKTIQKYSRKFRSRRRNLFKRKRQSYAVSPFINNRFASYRTIMECDWMWSMNDVSGGQQIFGFFVGMNNPVDACFYSANLDQLFSNNIPVFDPSRRLTANRTYDGKCIYYSQASVYKAYYDVQIDHNGSNESEKYGNTNVCDGFSYGIGTNNYPTSIYEAGSDAWGRYARRSTINKPEQGSNLCHLRLKGFADISKLLGQPALTNPNNNIIATGSWFAGSNAPLSQIYRYFYFKNNNDQAGTMNFTVRIHVKYYIQVSQPYVADQ